MELCHFFLKPDLFDFTVSCLLEFLWIRLTSTMVIYQPDQSIDQIDYELLTEYLSRINLE